AQPATGLSPIQYAPASIQECHVPHRLCLALRVHQDPVPAVQPDRAVVGVTDATSNVNTSISLHRAPAPNLRLRVTRQDRLVLRSDDAVRIARADIDRLPTRPITKLGPVRLAAVAPRQRLAPEDQLLIHDHLSDWKEKPLALATISSVLTPKWTRLRSC